MTITGLKSDHAVHEKMGPDKIDFVADMRLGVVRPGIDIDTLTGAIPIILRICEMQVRVPDFNVIILRRARLEIARETHHVFPCHDIHVPHVNVICGEEIFKRVGGLTRPVGRI